MRNYIATGAAMAAGFAAVNADLCSLGSSEILGNWYCQAVNAITYNNVGSTGTYQAVTNMDSATGTCSQAPFNYAGSLAPLDDQVSMHFRGPISIKQFAFYAPSHKKSRRSLHDSHAHGHAHFHEHQQEVREVQNRVEKRQEITAVIDGQTVSWAANAPAATEAPGNGFITAVINGVTVSWADSGSAPAAATGGASLANNPVGEKAPFKAPAPAAKGDWVRNAYYNADDQTSQGLTVLNNMGGQGSGVFDTSFGNSLSYASSDGQSGAAAPEVLANAMLPSNTEVIFFTDKPCDASCGYSRPGTVAMKGFSGRHKLFLYEFSMPDDGTTGFNANMPAIWMLNANIPRTAQYGPVTCSSWATGGGEFDLFEVLSSGATQAKSTFHGNVAGGDSDYFTRPTGSTIKAAVLMSNHQAHIKILPDSFNFTSSVTPAFVNSLASSTDNQQVGTSIFNLS